MPLHYIVSRFTYKYMSKSEQWMYGMDDVQKKWIEKKKLQLKVFPAGKSEEARHLHTIVCCINDRKKNR